MRVAALLALSGCTYAIQPDCGSFTELDGRAVDGRMCEERLRREYTLSGSFTHEEQAAVIAAGEAWREATGGRVALSWRIVALGADVRTGTGTSAREAGAYDSYRSDMWLRPGLAPAHIYATALHELGHSFGLGHTSPGEAMAPDVGAPITPADLEHFDRAAAASAR